VRVKLEEGVERPSLVGVISLGFMSQISLTSPQLQTGYGLDQLPKVNRTTMKVSLPKNLSDWRKDPTRTQLSSALKSHFVNIPLVPSLIHLHCSNQAKAFMEFHESFGLLLSLSMSSSPYQSSLYLNFWLYSLIWNYEHLARSKEFATKSLGLYLYLVSLWFWFLVRLLFSPFPFPLVLWLSSFSQILCSSF